MKGEDANTGNREAGDSGTHRTGEPADISIALSTSSLTFNYDLSGTTAPKETITVAFNGAGLIIGYPHGIAEPA